MSVRGTGSIRGRWHRDAVRRRERRRRGVSSGGGSGGDDNGGGGSWGVCCGVCDGGWRLLGGCGGWTAHVRARQGRRVVVRTHFRRAAHLRLGQRRSPGCWELTRTGAWRRQRRDMWQGARVARRGLPCVIVVRRLQSVRVGTRAARPLWRRQPVARVIQRLDVAVDGRHPLLRLPMRGCQQAQLPHLAQCAAFQILVLTPRGAVSSREGRRNGRWGDLASLVMLYSPT